MGRSMGLELILGLKNWEETDDKLIQEAHGVSD